MIELLRMAITAETDIFVVRQRGREVAAQVGLETQDQVRMATALSDVGRQIFAHLGATSVCFFIDGDRERSLCVSVSAAKPTDPALIGSLRDGIAIAHRLMESWEIEQLDGRVTITMGRPIPLSGTALDSAGVLRIQQSLAASAPIRPVDEFMVQNQQLIASLTEVQAQRDRLLQLNEELEETNRGVMALYNQLSEELEATNSGVVALYAELDEKSAQLASANEAKTRFMANVSHELRAPVTAILGLLRLLTDPRSDPLTEDQRQQIGLISDSASDMLARVNELLDLARAESGRLEPTVGEVVLSHTFDMLRGTMKAMAHSPTVEVLVVEPVGLPVLRTDQVMLSQVLRNLMTNAIKFTEHGEVRLVAAQPSPDIVQLSVSDTGIGIPPGDVERVFEEFYQIRNRIQQRVSGTGLGLPYARRLVELLGGELTLTSEVGVGSTFTVTIPVALAGAGDDDG